MLSPITEGKLKYTEPDEAAGKRVITSVESPQQPGSSRAETSAECLLQQQVKQRARATVECPKRKRQVSDSDRSSCTRPYGGSDEEMQPEEFAEEEDENPVLDEIKQEYTGKDFLAKPIGNRNLASIANNLFLVNMEEKKLEDLNKKSSLPENCPNMVTLKFNSDIWKSNLTSAYKMNKIKLHRIEHYLLQKQSKELISPVVDPLALLGKTTADLSQFRRNNLRSRLPGKMRQLATNVLIGSQCLFGDNLNKRIAQVSSMTNSLSQYFE